ncbi:MAG: RNA polymerase factor sigma-54 [Chlamydiia bacterium]|nr:RNA polymerase factor sigma-54 [Chlamydiia bacterium]
MTKNQIYLGQSQNLRQIQRLILTPQMQQALHLLQLPVLELSAVIEEELEKNPLLEYSGDEPFMSKEETENEQTESFDEAGAEVVISSVKRDEDLRVFLESSIAYESSLFDHLMQQAHEVFAHPKERELAQILIGNFDHQGFLSSPLEEIACVHNCTYDELLPILKQIQTFDPIGIGAANLQESLLIQLEALGKKEAFAYKIVSDHFSSMLHNKIPQIAKSLGLTPKRTREVIEKEIAHLDLHPGTSRPSSRTQEALQAITPDVNLIETSGEFVIEVSDEGIPPLKLNHSYLKLLEDPTAPKETKEYIKERIASGKWLIRNLQERHHTLYRITEEILRYQKHFFASFEGKLLPLTMKAVSEKLSIHESTVARACANKYLSCPRGVFPFRYFFTHAYVTESGELLSSKTVKELLISIVNKEDKRIPLSDEMISSMIKERGIPCARRTVAKYRQELGIGSTIQRKLYI